MSVATTLSLPHHFPALPLTTRNTDWNMGGDSRKLPSSSTGSTSGSSGSSAAGEARSKMETRQWPLLTHDTQACLSTCVVLQIQQISTALMNIRFGMGHFSSPMKRCRHKGMRPYRHTLTATEVPTWIWIWTDWIGFEHMARRALIVSLGHAKTRSSALAIS